MRLTKSSSFALVAAACATHAVCAEPSPELLDLAARVHYGYYHGEARPIEAALTVLDRLPESPEVLYYRDFAALRRAQLGSLDRVDSGRLEDCAEREVAAGLDKGVAADAWVLIAACALVGDDERRREQALARARERDDDNPRIGLVEAWALDRAASGEPGHREAMAGKLAAVVEAFQAWVPSIDDPDWGHAEALTALAANTLERGQVRTARDLVERALLIAPEYRAAVELRVALQGARPGESVL
jgi:hypothetical protein